MRVKKVNAGDVAAAAAAADAAVAKAGTALRTVKPC